MIFVLCFSHPSEVQWNTALGRLPQQGYGYVVGNFHDDLPDDIRNFLYCGLKFYGRPGTF